MIVTFQFNMHLKLTLIIEGECIIQEILTEAKEMLRGSTREPRGSLIVEYLELCPGERNLQNMCKDWASRDEGGTPEERSVTCYLEPPLGLEDLPFHSGNLHHLERTTSLGLCLSGGDTSHDSHIQWLPRGSKDLLPSAQLETTLKGFRTLTRLARVFVSPNIFHSILFPSLLHR